MTVKAQVSVKVRCPQECNQLALLRTGRLLEFPSCPSCGVHDRALGPAAGNSGRWSGGGRRDWANRAGAPEKHVVDLLECY